MPRTCGRKPERANIAPDTGVWSLGQSEEKMGGLEVLVEILKLRFALELDTAADLLR
jgi:hypothetical protein